MPIMFKWFDETEIDFETLPEASRRAIILRGVNHFNSEASAHVVAKAKQAIAGDNRKAESVTGPEVKSWRQANPEEASRLATEFFAARKAGLLDGTIGTRAAGGGTSVDPLMKEMLRIAAEEVKTLLEAHSLKMPRGEEVLKLAGQEFDRQALVSRQLERNRAKIEDEAKKVLAAKARKAKALVESGSELATALGL